MRQAPLSARYDIGVRLGSGFVKVIRDRIEGDYRFEEDAELHGVVDGSAVVGNGVSLGLFGIVTKELRLEKDSTVNLYGMVLGNVTNEGGNLTVLGIVRGNIIRRSGQTTVDSKAIVGRGAK